MASAAKAALIYATSTARLEAVPLTKPVFQQPLKPAATPADGVRLGTYGAPFVE